MTAFHFVDLSLMVGVGEIGVGAKFSAWILGCSTLQIFKISKFYNFKILNFPGVPNIF